MPTSRSTARIVLSSPKIRRRSHMDPPNFPPSSQPFSGMVLQLTEHQSTPRNENQVVPISSEKIRLGADVDKNKEMEKSDLNRSLQSCNSCLNLKDSENLSPKPLSTYKSQYSSQQGMTHESTLSDVQTDALSPLGNSLRKHTNICDADITVNPVVCKISLPAFPSQPQEKNDDKQKSKKSQSWVHLGQVTHSLPGSTSSSPVSLIQKPTSQDNSPAKDLLNAIAMECSGEVSKQIKLDAHWESDFDRDSNCDSFSVNITTKLEDCFHLNGPASNDTGKTPCGAINQLSSSPCSSFSSVSSSLGELSNVEEIKSCNGSAYCKLTRLPGFDHVLRQLRTSVPLAPAYDNLSSVNSSLLAGLLECE
ncbi:uncharacterized protein LOC143461674 isoform X2 [Clavelina lepadiformis]|uniref:uncharacterized protein LOC143461674 isoform X2 n=1 Tax=Clavelina lepadiformis TaxID=159417 RepID=UPI0040424978